MHLSPYDPRVDAMKAAAERMLNGMNLYPYDQIMVPDQWGTMVSLDRWRVEAEALVVMKIRLTALMASE